MPKNTWGSIRERYKGCWQIRYRIGKQRHQETFRGTRSEAERRLAELRIQYEDAEKDMTFREFYEMHFVPYMESELAPSTRSEYMRTWRRDVMPDYGDTLLRDFSPEDFQEYLLSMTHSKAKHCKAFISSMLSRAMALDKVDKNVAQRRYLIPKTRGRDRNMDHYTQDELDQIFADCHGEVWEPAFILAAFGGASREEAMGVKVAEVEFRDGFAIVPIVRGIQRIDGKIIVCDKPKNEYRERTLIIPPPYSNRLAEILDEHREFGYEWIMDDGFGKPLCPNNIANGTYKRWFLDKPYRFVPFGNLRKSYATAREVDKMDPLTVSNMMGHSQISTTYRHYMQPSVEQKIEMLSKSLGPDRA